MNTNTFITADGKYHIESLGNGWAYSVTDQRTGKNFFMQDSDAEELQRNTDNFECIGALDMYMEAIGGEA
jgi:hypothetical protein